jgi:tetratricopeptide (TPR) repeat protein
LEADFVAAYNNRGEAQYKKQNFDHAIEDYSRALKINPEFAIAYFNRALAWCAQKQPERAFENFRRVLELDPELLNAHCRVSEYLKKGSVDRVCRKFE